MDDASANFYIDDAMGGIAGASINADGTPGPPPLTPSSSSGGGSSSSSDDESPIRQISNISKVEFGVRSLNNKFLLIETNSPAIVEIYDLRGNKVSSFNTFGGSQTIDLSLPSGVYFAKKKGASAQSIKFVLK
jgi:hypothetical protein